MASATLEQLGRVRPRGSLELRHYRLVGHFAGRTVKFGDIQFTDGVLRAELTPEQHELLARHISQWGAKEYDGKCNVQADGSGEVGSSLGPEGEGATPSGQAADSSQPAGGGAVDPPNSGTNPPPQGVVPQGDRQEEGMTDPGQQKLLRAVMSLDHGVDADWTKGGKPALPAVERALGYGGVTRAQVEAVCPGLVRRRA